MIKKCVVVYNGLKKEILSGAYKDGDKLPTESELMERFQVSRQTIRQALEMLGEDHLILKSRGSGTFVHLVQHQLNTKRVAVITYSIADSVFPAMLSGMESVFTNKGYATTIYATQDSITRERQILKQLCEDPVDGILLHPVESAIGCANLDLIQQLRNMGTKFIFTGCCYRDPELADIPSVTMDNYDGIYQITKSLINENHKHVGGVFASGSTHIIERMRAVRQAIIDTGSFYDRSALVSNIISDDYENQIKLFAGKKLQNCDLIICSSGLFATPLIQTLQEIPHAAVKTIVIFDETKYPAYDGVNIIAYRSADVESGEKSAEKLLRIIRGYKEPSIVFPWQKI